MSPGDKRSFETEWAALCPRLRSLLARKRIAPAQHDDLLQETALRLVAMWDSIDRRRELWPLTVTIALNLLRDRGRAVNRADLVGEMPELRALADVETAGIARMELARVREAMNQLSESHRSILMKEIGGHTGAATPDAAADKMMRMRARKKLRSALEKVSGLVALRIRRLGDLFEGLIALRETGVTMASCAFCLALGVGSTVLPPPALMPEASAGPERGGSFVSVVTTTRAAGVARSVDPQRRAIAEARSAGSEARLVERQEAARVATRGRKQRQGGQTASGPDVLDPLPVGDDNDGVQNPATISVDDEHDAPPLPGGGGGDSPMPPPMPAPDPPPAPKPPLPAGGSGDSAGGDPLGTGELVEELL